MATTSVDIVVRTKGRGSVDQLTKSVGRLDTATNKLQKGLGGLKEAFTGIAGLAGVAVGLGAAFDQIAKADKAAAALRGIGADTKELLPALKKVRKELNNNVSQAELSAGAFQVLQS